MSGSSPMPVEEVTTTTGEESAESLQNDVAAVRQLLDVQREQADRTRQVDIAILLPAYEQTSNQANQEMIAYLQQVATSED